MFGFMSDDYSPQKDRAGAFNSAAALHIGWKWALPIAARDPYTPADIKALAAIGSHGYGTEVFAEAIADYQHAYHLTVDGKLGKGTWTEILRRIPRYGNCVLLARMHIPTGIPDVVIDTKTLKLDNYSAGCEDRRILVLHWGGKDARSCYNALTNKRISTHFMCDGRLHNGCLLVYQGVDLAHTAHHAGYVNGGSVGLDICRSPLIAWKDHYPGAVVRDNTTSPRRGESRYVDLEPEYGAILQRFIAFVAGLFDIPYGEYPGDGILDRKELDGGGSYRGVIGHHNASGQKWDVAPWSSHLWPRQ